MSAYSERGQTKKRHQNALLGKASPAQAVLLVALLMVVLLGFIGLAVDGGTLYFAQRNARNSADAGVLAAVYAMCTNYSDPNRDALVTNAAIAAVQANGYGNPGDPASSVAVQIGDTIPDDAFPAGFSGSKADYVRVEVWADSPTYLIQIVYGGPTEVTADAIGKCRPQTHPFPSQAIVALGNECRAIEIGGDGDMVTVDGGIFSNSTQCGGPCSGVYFGGSGTATIDDPGIGTSGCIYDTIGADGSTTTGVDPLPDPMADVPPPDDACGGAAIDHQGSGTINPGYYSRIKLTSGTLTLNPGIYCVDSGVQNDGFVATGGNIIADGVVIYIKTGVFSLSGNGDHSFTAPVASTCETYGTCDWLGMMLWMSRDNFPYPAGGVEINGGSASQFVGTIYAPVNKCTIVGNGSTLNLDAQLICYMVQTTGTGDIEIHYDPDEVYEIPPSLSYNK